jgi:hypothetical protein
MSLACFSGDEDEVVRLLDDGESVNCAVSSSGATPIMLAMLYKRLRVVQALAYRGADFTMVNAVGWNLLHYAAFNGSRECINSTTMKGETPIMFSLIYNDLNEANILVEKGANLFLKDKYRERAIDIRSLFDHAVVLGPQVLQHAKDIRWSSVKQLLLLSKAYDSSDVVASSSSSTHLATSVFTIGGLVRRIASFFINKKTIVKDPSIKKEDEEPDDVRRRIEAALAENEEKNRRTRHES